MLKLKNFNNFFFINNTLTNNNLIFFFKNFNFYLNNKTRINLINNKLNNNLSANLKINSINYFFFKKVNSNKLNNLSNFYKNNKFFFNFFYNYCLNKNNFIVLDTNYSTFYPLYKHIYGYNSLYFYKSFFFIDPKNFVLKNWLFFFLKFCKFNKINLIFIYDYDYYINFFKLIADSDISISAIVPYSYIDDYIDYPLYSFNTNILTKLLYTSYILYIHTLSFNYFNLIKQYKYIFNFNKYFLI